MTIIDDDMTIIMTIIDDVMTIIDIYRMSIMMYPSVIKNQKKMQEGE